MGFNAKWMFHHNISNTDSMSYWTWQVEFINEDQASIQV